MYRVAVLSDEKDVLLNKSVSGLESIEACYPDENNIPIECTCVIVSQKRYDRSLPRVISELKERGLTVCVAVEDGSIENQEDIISSGADDIFVLPMPAKLLTKRIDTLANNINLCDFTSLDRAAEADSALGSYIVDDNNFKSIYQFVLRLLERLDKKAQLIRFELKSRFIMIEPGIMGDFVTVVQRCLRRGDICCQNGNQLFVILMGADTDGGKLVAKRLIDSFTSVCQDDSFDIEYEMKEINK